MNFLTLPKLSRGDKVAILSPSFAAPAVWPWVYELGLQRVREVFGLVPVDFPSTSKRGASSTERARDLIAAFEDSSIKAVIAAIGGDDQITYIKNLPKDPFLNNPKPFFGYSDNSHFANHLWLLGIPSYYGGSLFTEFAMQGSMDEFTIKYLKAAFFEDRIIQLDASSTYNDIGLSWNDRELLTHRRQYESNDGWHWDGKANGEGITWGGCVESIDEMLRHGVPIPSLTQFEKVILAFETSEESPSAEYVFRVFRALGERGILERVRGLLVGRAKAWEFGNERSAQEKTTYRQKQREAVIRAVRSYNSQIPIVQNVDFGHTAPQICLPMGQEMKIDSRGKNIQVKF